MPMGIVSDEDFDTELSRLKIDPRATPPAPRPAKVDVIDIKKGRGEAKNTPEIIREIVARAAINGEGSGSEIASAFGVSESSVSAYKVGATSTASYNEPDDELLSTVLGHRKNIAKNARATLLAALETLTPERMSEAKARDLAAIAKDMSGIIVDMEPPVPAQTTNQQNVQFVFMAPRVRSEDTYEIREVND